MQILLQLLTPCLVYNLLAYAAPRISSTFSVNELLSDEIAIELQELNKEFQLIFSHSNGVTESLKLIKSEIKTISPHLNYGELDLNSNGALLIQSPTKHYTWRTQHDVYNAENHPDVHLVRNFKDGNHRFEGILGDKALKWGGDKHLVLNSLPDMPFSEEYKYSGRKKRNDNETTTESDIADPHRRLTYGRIIDTGPAVANVEIAIVFDYENSKFFDFDQQRITEYVAVLFNFINMGYATSEDPKITFSIVDIYITKSPEVEAYYINGSKIEGNPKDEHNADSMLELFGKWSAQHAKIIGNHDLIALLTVKPFQNGIGGMAYAGGACGFTENSEADLSASVNYHTGGIWEGRAILSHELAHNLGASHDQEAIPPCLNSSDIMGGGSKNSLSDCSKAYFKKFLLSQQASCLKTDERTPIEARVNMEYIESKLFEIVCQRKFNESFHEVADNVNPSEFCSGWVSCMNYVPGVGEISPTRLSTGYTIEPKEPRCGKTGTCQGKLCIGDRAYEEKAELDTLCKKKTGDATAFYNRDNYGTYNPCRWLSCEGSQQKYNHINYWMGDNAVCKNDGKCLNGECIGFKPATRRDLDRICQVGLKDETITGIADNLNPNNMCDSWSWCMKYEPGFGERTPVNTNLNFAKDEGTKCGRTGECHGNSCVGDSPYTDKGELDELCRSKLGDTKAFYNANNYGTYNPCQWLSCEGTREKFNFISFWMGENAPCRNNGTCKNGKCVGYGPIRRTEIDIACQVGFNKSSGAADDIKPDHMCQGWTRCMSYTPGYGERVPVGEGSINFKKPDGTECGKSGTCKNQICVGDSAFTDKKQLDMLCQEKVGDLTAVFDETAYEWPHGRCDWLGCTGSKGKAIIKFWMGDNTPCENGGKCKDGSCLKTDERTLLKAEVNNESLQSKSFQEVCQRVFNESFHEVADNINPNEFCDGWVTCMNYVPGTGESTPARVTTYHTCENGTKCGKTGTCQGKLCIGDRAYEEKAELDALCKNKTGDKTAFYNRDNYGKYNPCRWLSCEGSQNKYNYINYWMGDNAVCKNDGKCLNGECVGFKPATRRDLDRICQVGLKDETITGIADNLNPNHMCDSWSWCMKYEPGFGERTPVNTNLNFAKDEGTKCGRTGECRGNSCVGDSPYTDKGELDELCRSKLGDTKAFYNANNYGTYNPCQWLSCEGTREKFNFISFWMGKNAPCRNSGTCKNGKCVGYGPIRRTEIDIACQVRFNKSSGVADDIKPDHMCQGWTRCMSYTPGFGERVPVGEGSINFKKPDGTECGKSGTCKNQICVGDSAFTDKKQLDMLCQEKVGDPTAVFDETAYEWPHGRCDWLGCTGSKGKAIIKFWMGDNAPCEDGGKCKDGSCLKTIDRERLKTEFNMDSSRSKLFEKCEDGSCLKTDEQTPLKAEVNMESNRRKSKCKDGSCPKTDEPTPFKAEVNNESLQSNFFEKVCQRVFNESFHEVADNINPNEFCDGWVSCMNYVPGTGESTPARVTTYHSSENGTKCGKTGTCQGKLCIGDRAFEEKAKLDTLCKNKTGDETAFFNRDNYGKYNPCRWLSCEGSQKKYNYIEYWMGDNAVCKNDGKCLNGECVGFKPATRRDLDRICQVGLMNETIAGIADNLNPNTMCEGWSWCMKYEPGYGKRTQVHTPLYFAKEEGTNCGRTGVCRSNICVDNSPYTDKDELDKICQNKLGDNSAFYNPDNYGTYNPCQWLSCEAVTEKYNYVNFWMGDNAPCKNDGKCLNGECVGFKPATRRDLDRICQAGLMNDTIAGIADNLNPNTMCEGWSWCMKYEPGYGKRTQVHTPLYFAKEEGTNCGRTGVCRSNICVDNSPYTDKDELDKICQNKLGDNSAFYNPDNYGTYNPCQWLSCEAGTEKYNYVNFWMGDNAPCKNDGKCLNGECVGFKPATRRDLDRICQVGLMNETITGIADNLNPNNMCDGWSWCMSYEPGFGERKPVHAHLYFAKDEGTNCGRTGECRGNLCVGDSPYTDKGELDELCQRKLGDTKAFYNAHNGNYDPCQWLSCEGTGNKFNFISFWMGENAPCKNSGTCKNGECIGYGPLKRAEIDIACQAAKFNKSSGAADEIKADHMCQDWTWCVSYTPGYGERIPVGEGPIYFKKPDGTECGKSGTCKNQICVDDFGFTDKKQLDMLCQEKVGDPTAVFDETAYEWPHGRCDWLGCTGSKGKAIIKFWMGDNTPCENGGKCKDGSCLKTDDRTPLKAEVNNESLQSKSFQEVCQRVFNESFHEVADNINPNEFCDGWVSCMNYVPGTGESTPARVTTYHTCENGTRCGKTGTCQGKLCIGDRAYEEKAELDALCKNKTGDETAFYNRDNYGKYNPCRWLSCEGTQNKYNYINYWMGDNAVCKNDGKCLNGECVGFKPATRRDLDRICQVGLMNDTITGINDNLNPNNMCEGWSWCMNYVPGFGERRPDHTPLYFAKDEGTNCGRTGECHGNLCVGDSPYTDKGELDELCQRKLGDTKAFYNAHNYGPYNPCQWLSCEGTGNKFNFISFWMGENAPCKNSGTCKNGECIGYGPLKRAEIDIACQAAKFNKSSGAADEIKADHMCHDWTWCISYTPGYGERIPVGEGQVNFKKPDGTECGKSGICKNQICEGDFGFIHTRKLDMLCQEKVGDPTAVFDETAYEWPHGRCDWLGCTGSKGKAMIKFWMGDNTPCEDGGKCKDGSCQK